MTKRKTLILKDLRPTAPASGLFIEKIREFMDEHTKSEGIINGMAVCKTYLQNEDYNVDVPLYIIEELSSTTSCILCNTTDEKLCSMEIDKIIEDLQCEELNRIARYCRDCSESNLITIRDLLEKKGESAEDYLAREAEE
ncbi:hypothetical protein CCACVL1_31009 [Corchorus capsularis]|uniref:Uncharacterized protein n=1 Tax=Corchorus capsularis TaxID=210143 RepID=A0A1R3FU93_COCAP|nr:hypothetical protein CCACVL1_31009 [Corchorus capsularis]